MTAEDIKNLREKTGAGVMDAKRALEEAEGNMERALEIIQEKGLIKAEKKADRTTGDGIIFSYIHNEKVGVLLDLRCETDFVARTDDFKGLAHEIAMQIVAMDPESVEDLMAQPYIKDQKLTIEELVKGVIAKLGENIQIEKYCRYAI
ncbi:MAG: translation elongation factor Ts [Candidatus Colwellbacteria bacterium]|jgi:elongation factor Ts|nr:translation elongation factor Ts [Candidatus Colwellbacteria bacterium]MCK9497505.1 translation elongation factor Ts [Candidatus Colwellbacteria bacterium]MDD3752433.1 translation elongation factor Ts [Candidatus Colwellbacteria bacterium]